MLPHSYFHSKQVHEHKTHLERNVEILEVQLVPVKYD